MHGKRSFLLGILLLTLPLATAADVNSSIRVGDGEVREGELSTVNGKITIGDGATVRGDCQSVNGEIAVGRDAQVAGLTSVNGGVSVGDGTTVDEAIEAVNGRVSLGTGVRAKAVSTINGKIKLDGADVARDLRTINGDIRLTGGSSVGGNIVIQERGRGSTDRSRPLIIELEGGSVVEGDVLNEDPRIQVKIYLRDGSRIAGRVENAEVVEG